MDTFEFMVSGRVMVSARNVEAAKAVVEADMEEFMLSIDSIEEVR